jgi:hypothetical protein
MFRDPIVKYFSVIKYAYFRLLSSSICIAIYLLCFNRMKEGFSMNIIKTIVFPNRTEEGSKQIMP